MVGLSPISFTFLKLSVAKLVKIIMPSSRLVVGYLYTSIFLYQSQNREGCKAAPLLVTGEGINSGV